VGASAEIYGYERKLEWALNRLGSSSIHEANKELIERFCRYLFANSLSLDRILKLVREIRKVSELLDKPFEQTTKDDVIELVRKIESRTNYTEWTKRDYKYTIKRFYKFLRGTDDYPEEVRWIRLKVAKGRILPEELLSEDDVKRMVEVARTPRNKALILVLYESGCRIGEILSLKLRNVQFDEYGAVLTVDRAWRRISK